jgi:hypothetical protein
MAKMTVFLRWGLDFNQDRGPIHEQTFLCAGKMHDAQPVAAVAGTQGPVALK